MSGSVGNCEVGLNVQPEEGAAVLWYNLDPASGAVEEASFHAGCDVIEGEKWAANNWFYNRVPAGFQQQVV